MNLKNKARKVKLALWGVLFLVTMLTPSFIMLSITPSYYTKDDIKEISDNNTLGSSYCVKCDKSSDDPNIYKN